MNGRQVVRNDSLLYSTDTPVPPEEIYRSLGYSYPKFFKMDLLSKWAWLATEGLLADTNGWIYEQTDKTKIAVVLMTGHGCLDVDKKYQQTITEIPSPALFVYTLPNIMLGEICIRHGIKGEQACLVSSAPDWKEIHFLVTDLMDNRGTDACICGWVDATNDNQDLALYWITKGPGEAFSVNNLEKAYHVLK